MKKETRILKDAVHKSIDIFFGDNKKNGSSDNAFIQAGFKAIWKLVSYMNSKKIGFFMALSSICHFF